MSHPPPDLVLPLTDHVAEMAHGLLAQVLTSGDAAVDATCGRGRDTLFLARQVGREGCVYAFDIQKEALDSTRRLLAENQILSGVILYQADHADMASYVPAGLKGVLFNLGFLPGGDETILTKAESTALAVEAALGLLALGGMLVTVCYPGHGGGPEEKEAVEEKMKALPAAFWRTGGFYLINKKLAPCLFYALKVKEEAV